MQKRSFDEAKVPQTVYSPVELDPAFPIRSVPHHQGDQPITRVHLHDCLEIGYCHFGSGIFVVEDKVLSYGAEDVCLINDRELHLARSADGTVSEWTFLYLDPLRLVGSVEDRDILDAASLGGPSFANILAGAPHAVIAGIVTQIIEELNRTPAGYRSLVKGLVWALMARAHRLPGRSHDQPETGPRRGMRRVAPALQYMTAHLGDAIRIDDLARLCYISVSQFRRVFKSSVGQAPLQYLVRLRIRMAGTLLHATDRSVLDISLEVGYPTLSGFNRHFRMVMGMSPTTVEAVVVVYDHAAVERSFGRVVPGAQRFPVRPGVSTSHHVVRIRDAKRIDSVGILLLRLTVVEMHVVHRHPRRPGALQRGDYLVF